MLEVMEKNSHNIYPQAQGRKSIDVHMLLIKGLSLETIYSVGKKWL